MPFCIIILIHRITHIQFGIFSQKRALFRSISIFNTEKFSLLATYIWKHTTTKQIRIKLSTKRKLYLLTWVHLNYIYNTIQFFTGSGLYTVHYCALLCFLLLLFFWKLKSISSLVSTQSATSLSLFFFFGFH